MNRSVIILAVLLAAAMLGSYFSWTYEDAGKEEKGVVLLDIEPEDLQSLKYEEEDFKIEIVSKSDKLGDYYWAEAERKIKPPKKPNGEDAGEATTKKFAFKASQAAEDTFEDFAPFHAARQLENVSDDNLKEFGLDNPQGTLTLGLKAGPRAFDVGKEGYGHRQYYLRDQETKAIYLFNGQPIRSLRRGDNRLPERRLVEAEMRDVVSFTAKSGEVNATFEQKNASDRAKAYWVEPGQTEKNVSAKTWIEKLMRTRATEYAGDDVKQDLLEVAATIEVKTEKDATTIELLRGQKPDGQEAWYGRSAFTRGLVALPPAIMGALVPDVVTLVGLEPPPREPAKPPASAPASAPAKPDPALLNKLKEKATQKAKEPAEPAKPADPHAGHDH